MFENRNNWNYIFGLAAALLILKKRKNWVVKKVNKKRKKNEKKMQKRHWVEVYTPDIYIKPLVLV